MENAAKMASEELRPRLTSVRGSPEYKRETIRALMKRATKQSLEKL
jgi:CO/xanthine dehydrogenase FAD-binding subunit